MAVLAIGASGGQVADLQRRLTAAGFNPGAVDGSFGPSTLSALQNYQRAHGLTPDGVYGPQTANAFATIQGTPQGAPAPTGAAPGASPMNPEEDPAYLRFAAAQGVREDELRGYTAMRQSALQQELTNRVASMEHQANTDMGKIGGEFGARGAYLSGGRVYNQEQALAQARLGETEEQTKTQNQQNDLQAQMQNNVAEMRRATTEAGMQTRETMPVANANQGIY